MAKDKNWKNKSLKKLVEASDKKEAELADLKLQHSQGKLTNTAKLKEVKKELARINTFLNEKASKDEKDKS